jgi:hypothetical protein
VGIHEDGNYIYARDGIVLAFIEIEFHDQLAS